LIQDWFDFYLLALKILASIMPKKDIIAPILFLLAAAAAPACAQTGQSATLVPPSHPLIHYTGRFDKRSPQNYRFDWPGNIIELRFGGASCAVRIRGDGGYYNIYVDDRKSVMRFDTLERVHILADSLAADTAHHLKIVKRFEGLKEQVAELKGFYIGKGKALYPLPEEGPFPYRIEFIGGSNLLGFGVEANTVHCDTPAVYSDMYLSFGAAAARGLGADYRIAAMSGKGLTRGYNSPFYSALRPFGFYYGRTVKNDSLPRWDFSSWVPDVVVTSFGVNDFSTRPHPPKALFIGRYRAFVQEIYLRNPKARVVCMTSSREPLKTYVAELVEELRSEGDARIRFYSFAQIPKRLCGCDWHPNVEAQAQIGAELAEVIRQLMD
jgi:hypothetical protein